MGKLNPRNCFCFICDTYVDISCSPVLHPLLRRLGDFQTITQPRFSLVLFWFLFCFSRFSLIENQYLIRCLGARYIEEKYIFNKLIKSILSIQIEYLWSSSEYVLPFTMVPLFVILSNNLDFKLVGNSIHRTHATFQPEEEVAWTLKIRSATKYF